jgi:hypothetical protein
MAKAHPNSEDASLQKNLFDRIRQKVSVHLSFVEEIAEVLTISTDSAYRRLRCETPVTLEETVALCRHFKIALEEIIPQPQEAVTFNRFSIHEESLQFADYLTHSLQYFETFRGLKNNRIIYAAKDIPVFYHFMFPQLASFKLYFWLKTIKGSPEFKNTGFSFDIIPPPYITLCNAISRSYFRIPGIEIWNEETSNSTLRQINYYYEAGLFPDKSVPLLLLEQVELLIRHVHTQAENGSKLFEHTQTAVSYELYYNEVLLLDNTIFARSDQVSSVLISYNAIDYITTTNESFCKEVLNWLDIQMQKSALISKTSEKERNRFFNKIYDAIRQLKKKII